MNILLLFPGFIVALIIVFCYEHKIRRIEPRNKVHFYVARDKNKSLYLYFGKPLRALFSFYSDSFGMTITSSAHFSKYGLNKDDYANLKWEDGPVEVFINMED